LKEETFLRNISVLLVRTRQPGNIGAAARAMQNMGLGRLKLVDPVDLENAEVSRMAVGAFDLVEKASVFSTFDEAVAEENVIVGTTSVRGRRQRSKIYTVGNMARIIRDYAQAQRVCLVFGPERGGLTEAQLARCQYLASIPASLIFPTLNVAQSVLVLAYEIYKLVETKVGETVDLVSQAEREDMYQHMEKTLVEIGFLSQSNPGHIMRSIRRFLASQDCGHSVAKCTANGACPERRKRDSHETNRQCSDKPEYSAKRYYAGGSVGC
jgi:tRNA/rRNA methyltransferase